MKIRLNVTKNPWENAAAYFEKAKKARAKLEGARKALIELDARIAKLEKQPVKQAAAKVRVKEARKREWFEKFHWTNTTNGFLIVAGRDAKQNELLVARHLEEMDLFFHADVHGAAATILKKGVEASEQDLREAAQFAACYSNAWKLGAGAADVYAVRSEQVGKYSHGEFVARGGFVIRGERKWFKNTELKLVLVNAGEERTKVFPALGSKKGVLIVPGNAEKSVLVKELAKDFDENEVMRVLPGKSEVKKG